ncbi:MAG TPA: ArsA-related P-loop ATPase [Myxococcales bacterium]|nr:ArsA-related P-loop ATPase [Myxococcales bacterium]
MTTRLHVLLGQGGVGKTTLASAAALALARRGRKVGLLGVDPSGRLRDALGMAELAEHPVDVPGAPRLRAALLRPGDSLRRWAAVELGADEARLQRSGPRPAPVEGEARSLQCSGLENPFFLALADRLAAATDAFAAVRVAEWAEKDPDLDDLVVDTAPGLNGLEFLRKPERLLSVLHGRILRWLSNAATAASTEREARRVLRGLSRITGGGVLLELAEFSLLMERIGAAMIGRLERASSWLRDESTEMLLICVARPGAAAGTRLLVSELDALGFEQGRVVLNRALPRGLATIPLEGGGEESRAFRRYVRASARLQAEAERELEASFRVVEAPIAAGLGAAGPAHLAALEALGENLLGALAGSPPRTA